MTSSSQNPSARNGEANANAEATVTDGEASTSGNGKVIGNGDGHATTTTTASSNSTSSNFVSAPSTTSSQDLVSGPVGIYLRQRIQGETLPSFMVRRLKRIMITLVWADGVQPDQNPFGDMLVIGTSIRRLASMLDRDGGRHGTVTDGDRERLARVVADGIAWYPQFEPCLREVEAAFHRHAF